MKSFFICLITAFLVLMSVDSAKAQEEYPVGRVVAVEGDVRFGENGPTMRQGDPIYMDTVVATGESSRAIILLIDDTEINMGSNSEFAIDQFVFDPYDKDENRARFSLMKGVFLYVGGMLEKRDSPRVELETPYGNIGIRGTVVWCGHMGDSYGVYVNEGKVAFATDEEIIGIPAGTGVLINTYTEERSAVNVWSPKRMKEANKMVSFREDRELTSLIEQEMVRNIQRRSEYRKLMWPYKEMPVADPEQTTGVPYSDEFLRLKESGHDDTDE